MKILSLGCIAAAACAAAGSGSPSRTTAPLNAPVAQTYSCGDSVLADQSTSGGERLVYWQPCWDLEGEQERGAHADVTPIQTSDRKLAEAEAMACEGVGPREREHSPFSHQKDIAEVIPHRVSGQLAGVVVVFKPVPGLTAEWMRKDLRCHRARWENLGKNTIAASDPTLLDGAQVTVTDQAGHVEVLVETATPEQAEVAIARAMGTLTPVPGSQSAVR